jgi:hypothetical protein
VTSEEHNSTAIILLSLCILMLNTLLFIQTNRGVALHARIAVLEQQANSPPVEWARQLYQSKLQEKGP